MMQRERQRCNQLGFECGSPNPPRCCVSRLSWPAELNCGSGCFGELLWLFSVPSRILERLRFVNCRCNMQCATKLLPSLMLGASRDECYVRIVTAVLIWQPDFPLCLACPHSRPVLTLSMSSWLEHRREGARVGVRVLGVLVLD